MLDLPYDYERPAVQSYEGKTTSFKIAEEEMAGIRRLVKEQKATLFIFLLAVFDILLSKLSGQEDVIVGTPIAGRGHAEAEEVDCRGGKHVRSGSFPGWV